MKVNQAIILAVIFFLSAPSFALKKSNDSARTLVHLLDYIASDYGGAVSNGKIINASEHKEHIDLITSACALLQKDDDLQDKSKTLNLNSQMSDLLEKIKAKGSQEEIGKISQLIKSEINIVRVPGLPKVLESESVLLFRSMVPELVRVMGAGLPTVLESVYLVIS